MRRCDRGLAAAIATAAIACGVPRPVPADGFAIVGATVVARPGEAPLADAIVIVDGTRIRSVGPRSAVALPKGLEVIDGRGLWVVTPTARPGTIAAGQPADLLLVEEDPRADPRTVETPRRVIRGGRLFATSTAR
jgi:imidazolonepropionase-like amidohydrolase